MWLLFFDVLLWASVFVLHAVRSSHTSLSPFELKRRVESGDSEALRLEAREQLLPRVQTVHRIVETVLQVIAIALAILVFGWVVGVIVASALCLLLDSAWRLGPVARRAQTLYETHESRLLELMKDWAWLDWLRSADAENNDHVATSKPELQHIIERSAGVLSRDELLRVQAGLLLDTHSVEDVMTPVSVVETADVHDSLGPLILDGLHKTGHSRFPVIDGDIHHIVGVLYLHDIINLRSAKSTVREAMDPRVHYIHEHQSLEHALHGFLRTHHHLFVVVNDYRETVGVLTLEDVLETLLGKKIVDEFDQYEDLRAVAESNPRKNNLPKGKADI